MKKSTKVEFSSIIGLVVIVAVFVLTLRAFWRALGLDDDLEVGF